MWNPFRGRGSVAEDVFQRHEAKERVKDPTVSQIRLWRLHQALSDIMLAKPAVRCRFCNVKSVNSVRSLF